MWLTERVADIDDCTYFLRLDNRSRLRFLQVSTDPDTGETLIAGMGQLHLDVIVQRIQEEYDCDCIVGLPRVAYRERPTRPVEFEHKLRKQTGGPGQMAHIVGRLEPLPLDANDTFVFEDQIVGGRIDRRYIAAVRDGFSEALVDGPLSSRNASRLCW